MKQITFILFGIRCIDVKYKNYPAFIKVPLNNVYKHERICTIEASQLNCFIQAVGCKTNKLAYYIFPHFLGF